MHQRPRESSVSHYGVLIWMNRHKGLWSFLEQPSLYQLVAHIIIKRYILAIVIAIVIAPVLFQVFAYWHAGYLDPFFVIALVVSQILTGVISAIVGLPFYFSRKF